MECKIGLIAKPLNRKQNCFLNIGEIFDKNIRNNINVLYELHTIMKYMYPFKIKIENKDIIPDNLTEIAIIQEKYKLTRKISLYGKDKDTKFRTPELYDISCMVPLFPNQIPRLRFTESKNNPIRMIVLFPYENPILRGEILNSCFNLTTKCKTYFYTLGYIRGKNTSSTCELSKRYLLTCGIKKENIYTENYDTFPDCIMEILNMIKFIFPYTVVKIMFAIARYDMQKFMDYIRLNNAQRLSKQKIQLICN